VFFRFGATFPGGAANLIRSPDPLLMFGPIDQMSRIVRPLGMSANRLFSEGDRAVRLHKPKEDSAHQNGGGRAQNCRSPLLRRLRICLVHDIG
jgi:hypothetical protein